jgi:soluble lytic murein transglycosylase
VKFIRGFALEQLKRYPDAIDAYLSIPDGRAEYYGWRATERLRLLAGNEDAKPYTKQKADSLAAEVKDTETRRKNIQSLLRLIDPPEEREKLLISLKKVYADLPGYQKLPAFKLLTLGRSEELKKPSDQTKGAGDELAFLGLYDEAAPELAKAVQNNRNSVSSNPQSQIPNPKSDDLAYAVATLYKRGNIADKAVAFAEPLWRQVPADYEIELIPKDQLEMLYPAPYADSLLNYAAPRDVDSRFVLSIMRQESRYRADVKSYAAARGLMQFISSTGEKIAAELGRKNFRNDELFYPPTAVLFGSQYLADLFKQFPGQAQAVAASYNAGEDNMQRWLTRSGSNQPDNFVPEVVFSQSKDYVYKVMTAYRMYQFLYDENLKTR